MEIVIKHNTYLKKTEFILPPSLNKTLTITKIENNANFIWEWLPKLADIIQEINVDKITFTLKARQEDCDIFQQYIKDHHNKFKDTTNQPKYEIDQGLELHTIKSKIENLLNSINASYLKDNFDLQMNAVQDYINEPTEIIVTAPMSAGKSTLINSMIGSEILASGNEACTSIITKIVHADIDETEYSIDDQQTWNKFNYKDIKNLHKGNIQAEFFEKSSENNDNNENNEKTNESNQPLQQITIKHKLSKLVDDNEHNNSFVFIDTPGTNNASNKEHCKITFDYIHGNSQNSKLKTKPIVLFIANITNGDVTEDAEIILKEVSKVLNNAKNSTISDRFIFILNKADAETLEDKNLDEIQEALEDHIKKWSNKLSEHSYDIRNPKIFPISAEHSLLANRESELGRKSKDTLDKLKSYITDNELFNLSNLSTLSNHDKKELKNQFQGKSLTEQVEYYSGVPAVEYYIKNYVSKYTLPIKLNAILSEISHKLDFAFTKAKNVESLLNSDNELDENKYAEFKAKTQRLLEKLQNSIVIEDVKRKSNSLNFNEEINPIFNNISANLNEELDKFTKLINEDFSHLKSSIQEEIQKFINHIPNVTSAFEADVEEKNIELREDLIKKSENVIIGLFSDEELQEYGIKESLKISNDFSNVAVNKEAIQVRNVELKTKSNIWYECRDFVWNKYMPAFLWSPKKPEYYEKTDIEQEIQNILINLESECDQYAKNIQIIAEENFKDFKQNLNKSIDDIIDKISDYINISKKDQELIKHKDKLDTFKQALDYIFIDKDLDDNEKS